MSADVGGGCVEAEMTTEEQMKKALMQRPDASGEYENATCLEYGYISLDRAEELHVTKISQVDERQWGHKFLHIKNIIEKEYGVDFYTWALCQTTDNYSVNKYTAKWLNIPHVPCANHLLNSQVCTIINKLKEKNDRLRIGKVVFATNF